MCTKFFEILFNTLVFLFILSNSAVSAERRLSKDRLYIGIQPSITAEPFYERGDFDLNLSPVVVGFGLGKIVDLKIVPLTTYHFGSVKQLQHLGAEVNLPIYFLDRSTDAKRKRVFLAPLAGIARNMPNKLIELTLGAEVGYTLVMEKDFELKFGLQEGATVFIDDKVVNHFGVKISFGKWLL